MISIMSCVDSTMSVCLSACLYIYELLVVLQFLSYRYEVLHRSFSAKSCSFVEMPDIGPLWHIASRQTEQSESSAGTARFFRRVEVKTYSICPHLTQVII